MPAPCSTATAMKKRGIAQPRTPALPSMAGSEKVEIARWTRLIRQEAANCTSYQRDKFVVALRLHDVCVCTELFASPSVLGSLRRGENRGSYVRHGRRRSNHHQQIKPWHPGNIEIQQEEVWRLRHCGDRPGGIFSVRVVLKREG